MSCKRLPFIPDTPNDDLVLLHQFHVSETYVCHTHEFYEVFYVVKGQAIHKINNVSQVVSEGSLVFIRPNDIHYYQSLNVLDFEFININITPEMTYQTFDWLRIPQEAFNEPELPPTLKLTGAQHLEMRRKFIELSEMTPGPARRRAFFALLPEILLLLYNHQDAHALQAIPQWLSALLKKLDQPECFTRGLPELLRLTPYTQEHLTRSFRKYVHMSPTAYINQKRLSYAAELLTAQDDAPAVIAQRVGFNNLSHFYHLFRQQYGCTPLQFSQQYRDLQHSQRQYLAHISHSALAVCLQPDVKRIALEEGIFAYFMQNGRAQIYISFEQDATERNLNELTACWDPRITAGSTVHINCENRELLQHLCSKFHCTPASRTREMQLTRSAWNPPQVDVSLTDIAFSAYNPALYSEYAALLPQPLLTRSALADIWARCARNGVFRAIHRDGKLAGFAWYSPDTGLKYALHPQENAAEIERLLFSETVLLIFSSGAEQFLLQLTDLPDERIDFFRSIGFVQTAHEAQFYL